MTSYAVKATINASPEELWGLLTDAKAVPSWSDSRRTPPCDEP